MDEKELFELYKKLYFHELESRDKINSKLQVPFTIIVTLIGFLSYMLKNYVIIYITIYDILFISLYMVSITFTILSIYNFKMSWFGYQYKLLPYTEDTAEYRKTLVDTYKNFKDCEDLVKINMQTYIQNCFIEGATINAKHNDKRTSFLYQTNKFILYSVIFAFLAFIPFHLRSLFREYDSSIQNVRIVEPITILEK